jgi:hypothetical protein
MKKNSITTRALKYVDIDDLQRHLKADIEKNGPILLWAGRGNFPGGDYRGLNLDFANLSIWALPLETDEQKSSSGMTGEVS